MRPQRSTLRLLLGFEQPGPGRGRVNHQSRHAAARGAVAAGLSHVLERRQLLPRPLPETFGFFKNPHNLGALTPPWLHFRIASVSDSEIREGTRIEYRLRLHGVPLRWESVISEYVENAAFADRMVSGPYRRWHHRHEFRAVPGGTEMRDRVEYELPFGLLGRLGHFLVRRQLREIFDYRAVVIGRILEGR